jgi:hypothetical protein
MKQLRKSLKQARKQLAKQAKALPDKDAYASIYSILVDAVESIDNTLKEIGPALKEAKKYDKDNPNQGGNRAIKWCYKP